ncbi:MAG: hypothetical protein QOJ85_2779 [Solirubrobacteraceae bacterium]|nr:hypothetical protein [Solirubrobacteraceae bacterium]
MDGAKTAGELYGRALVVFAAQHYASQLVLAASKRRGLVLPRSHKDTARKAFERVTKGVLPASHTQLQRAIAAEARGHERSIAQLDSRRAPDASQPAMGEGVDDHVGDGAGPDPDDDLDMQDRGD